MMISMPTAPAGRHRFNREQSLRRPAHLAIGFAALFAVSAHAGNVHAEESPGATTQKAAAPQEKAATVDQVMGMVHVCSSCHGFDGRSISPTFPRLAGQRAEYLEAQLTAFRDHTRADPHARTYMWGMAGHLSDSLIHGLATYFAAQPPASGTPGDPADMAAGQKIFQEGIPDHDVPACQACHGEHAEGQLAFPRLAGQHHDYLVTQLQNFASNARENEIMHENSRHLTPEEIRQVTAYLAAQ